MEKFEGHKYSIQKFRDSNLLISALSELRNIPDNRYDLLENPFEKKLTLRNVATLPLALEQVVIALEGTWKDWSGAAFGAVLELDYTRHYCSIFKMLPGGFLAAHVDAGIHPIKKVRKHATAILYIGEVDSGGALELWGGENCNSDNPVISEPVFRIEPSHGNIVFFENNDYAWHAVGAYSGERPRYAITVSYMSQEIDRWNKRERAFFAPRPDEVWDNETYKLRNLRADKDRYAEVYRTNP